MTTWADLVEAGVARRDVDLAPLTTYKLGGPAGLFVEADSVSTLERVGEARRADPRPILVLGRGSNVLISDSGFPGVVLRLGQSFSSMTIDDEGVVEAGGALTLPRLARGAAREGLGGLEWCVGVPGSVGGAVRQNAGCFGREVVDILIDAAIVSLADGAPRIDTPRRLGLSYRHSNLAPDDVVVSARFSTTAADPEASAAEMKEVTRWRKENQPGGTLNAGSVFKNPASEAAGSIIDRLGLRGFGPGRVRVSPRHANFIEADPGATAAEVKELIDRVRARVEAETGIALETEIQFVGFDEAT